MESFFPFYIKSIKDYLLTASFNALPGLKAGAFDAGATVGLGAGAAEGSYSFSAGNAGMTTTTTTTTTSTQYGLGGAQTQYGASGAVMGVTQATEDNAVDVTYSTKAEGGVTTLGAMTTSTTVQPYTTTRVLKPIIINSVRPAIVSNTVLNPMVNNVEPTI